MTLIISDDISNLEGKLLLVFDDKQLLKGNASVAGTAARHSLCMYETKKSRRLVIQSFHWAPAFIGAKENTWRSLSLLRVCVKELSNCSTQGLTEFIWQGVSNLTLGIILHVSCTSEIASSLVAVVAEMTYTIHIPPFNCIHTIKSFVHWWIHHSPHSVSVSNQQSQLLH